MSSHKIESKHKKVRTFIAHSCAHYKENLLWGGSSRVYLIIIIIRIYNHLLLQNCFYWVIRHTLVVDELHYLLWAHRLSDYHFRVSKNSKRHLQIYSKYHSIIPTRYTCIKYCHSLFRMHVSYIGGFFFLYKFNVSNIHSIDSDLQHWASYLS